jgi:hypothetical protein
MSLNRCEQRVFDYLERHRDERQYWQDKVRGAAESCPDPHAAAFQLAVELWRYYEERRRVASPFWEAMRVEGLQKTSMKNLAELLLRLWVEPRPKRNPRLTRRKKRGLRGTFCDPCHPSCIQFSPPPSGGELGK